jgi:DNA-binding transcriptional MerR regulator
MYIGKLSALTGATRKAIRHYERLGLLPTPQRKGNYRVYSEIHLHLVIMIRRAQEVGFNLSELHELSDRKVQEGRFPLAVANRLFDAKQAQLRRKIQEIEALERELLTLREELNRVYGPKSLSQATP